VSHVEYQANLHSHCLNPLILSEKNEQTSYQEIPHIKVCQKQKNTNRIGGLYVKMTYYYVWGRGDPLQWSIQVYSAQKGNLFGLQVCERGPFSGWRYVKGVPFSGWRYVKGVPFSGWRYVKGVPFSGWRYVKVVPFHGKAC